MCADEIRRYRARVATTEAEIASAQFLRNRAFHPESSDIGTLDVDLYDPICTHVLIEDKISVNPVATFRFLPLSSGAEVDSSYSSQFYDLSALKAFRRPMIELGRFCVAPERADPEILRTAWGALTGQVDRIGAALIFGCSSFKGTDSAPYSQAFALLKERHLAPRRFLPRIKAPKVFNYGATAVGISDRAAGLRCMPPLLRSYLSMGGWVSDHAVIDSHMNTLHVFTGLEVERIPPARARVLRAVTG